MEKGCSYPDKAVLTHANEHDHGQLEIFIDDKECMYVFDRGYLDYKRFDRMTDEEGYFFVDPFTEKRRQTCDSKGAIRRNQRDWQGTKFVLKMYFV